MRVPSAVIQCELYRLLRNEGLCVKPEFALSAVAGKRKMMRADLAIQKGYKIIGLIECKNSLSTPNQDSIQWKNYEATGIPFRFCMNWPDMDNIVAWAISLWKNS